MILSLDIETTSGVDLKKTGVYVYAADPEFKIQLLAYSINGGAIQQIDLTAGEEISADLVKAILDPKVIKRAYNAAFERICLSAHILGDQFIDAEGWECTSVRASASGLPASLDEVCKALELPDGLAKKDGKRLLRLFAIARADPAEYPNEWRAYKAYNQGDVMAEMAVRARIDRECPFTDQAIYVLDQRINDEGVMLDIPFVDTVLELENKRREALESEVKGLTWLKNPNSPAALIKWLNMHLGIELTSANKESLAEVQTDDPIALQVLAARREMSLSSVKKFAPMKAGASEDGRIRGLFRMNGAGRTGRFSSVRLQVQNLARGDGKLNLKVAKDIIRTGSLSLVEMCYPEPMAVLSSLVRPALIATPGNELIIGDFSSIEAMIIAWYAGEEWKLELFRNGGKVYEAAAARMYNRPVEEIIAGVKAGEPWAVEMRAKGKIAELACIAEDQLVLTDRGLVPIQQVQLSDLLWDGVEWVSHEGVIFKGRRKTLGYEGLIATADHLVWVEGQPEPIQFGVAAASRQNIVQSGSGRQGLRMGVDNKRRAQVHEGLEPMLRSHRMYVLRGNSMDVPQQSHAGKDNGLSAMQPTQAHTSLVGSKAYRRKAAVRKSKRCRLCELRRSRYPVQLQLGAGSGLVPYRKIRYAGSEIGAGSHKQQRPLRSWKSKVPNQKSKSRQPKAYCSTRMETGRLALRLLSGIAKVKRRHDAGANSSRGLRCSAEPSQKLARDCGEANVYDILNAGPRNRFTVSNALVHNCGYQGAVGALAKMGGEKMGMSEDDMRAIVSAWRRANPAIVRLWHTVEEAVRTAIATGQRTVGPKGLRFHCIGRILSIQLPSGRHIYYRNVGIKSGKVVYAGYSTVGRKWGEQTTYGGRAVENIVQATARDCLTEAMMRVAADNYKIVMHVHDEIVADMPRGTPANELKALMVARPDWAVGLPLGAKVETSEYYTK